MADPLAVLLAAALAVAPVPSASPSSRPAETAAQPQPAGSAPALPVPETSPVPTVPQSPGPALKVIEGPERAPAPAPTGFCYGSRPCKRLVVLASVTGGLGLTAIVVGGVLAARPQRVDPDDPTTAIAYRPAGAAVLAIGLGVLATSLLMTLTALRASRHAKKAALSSLAGSRPLTQRRP